MMNTTAALERLLTSEEAAEFLRISPRNLRTLWSQRQIAAIKVGRRVRFDPADLREYVAAHRVLKGS